ncbi:MAG: low temperature requirement protein A [Candidatus Gracilibacteria bacterium]|nr:low temperature requirement protein A [Candidatus Gracilibacteria bacterium]
MRYVVVMSAIVHGLYHLLVEHQVFFGIGSFIFVFFTIWWSWMNYTWFSSVYDNDDVIFRILTFFQIFGLLVFTAGIASTMTENPNFAPEFIGFIIMRVVMVL